MLSNIHCPFKNARGIFSLEIIRGEGGKAMVKMLPKRYRNPTPPPAKMARATLPVPPFHKGEGGPQGSCRNTIFFNAARRESELGNLILYDGAGNGDDNGLQNLRCHRAYSYYERGY